MTIKAGLPEDTNPNPKENAVEPPLRLTSVSYSYGSRKVLDDVSFSIDAGRFAVLLGLNGAGKTTLFSLISHLFSPQTGTIRIFGHDIRRKAGSALRRLGIVFQARTLDLDLSVQQNLAYHASLHGIGAGVARDRIRELLASIDMGDRLHDKARNLSGGQMRRVEIVRALLHRPSLLLLDEATVGLDIKSRAAILTDIRRLVEQEGTSVLWATHLIDEVNQADQVVVLNAGKMVADGTASEVVRQTGSVTLHQAFSRLTGIADIRSGGARP